MFAGLHRSAKKEDIIKFKVVHLETTLKYLKEHSERVRRKQHCLWLSTWNSSTLSLLYMHAHRKGSV